MIDRLKLEKWRGAFCVLAYRLGLDVACTIDHETGVFMWHSVITSEHWHVYKVGREHERCAAACALAQQKIDGVVSSTDWQSVNAVARAIG